jgi:hypothetical protein
VVVVVAVQRMVVVEAELAALFSQHQPYQIKITLS